MRLLQSVLVGLSVWLYNLSTADAGGGGPCDSKAIDICKIGALFSADGAHNKCYRQQMVMATVKDIVGHTCCANFNSYLRLWMGYYTPGSWFSLSGEFVSWNNWKYPNILHYLTKDYDCVIARKALNSKWQQVDCADEEYLGLCEKDCFLNVTRPTNVKVVGRKCYWITTRSSRRKDANDQCRNDNGNLAYVSDVATWNRVINEMGQSDDKLWIGLTQKPVVSVSYSGELLDWTNWKDDDPNSEGCVAICMDKDRWYTSPCSNTYHHLCSKVYDDSCRNNVRVLDKCYWLHGPSRLIQSDASNQCSVDGGRLAVVPNYETWQLIASHYPNPRTIWIGARGYKRPWYSFDGKIQHYDLEWNTTQPNDVKHHCVVINGNTRKLFDRSCKGNGQFYGLCQKLSAISPDSGLRETEIRYAHINDAYAECKKYGALATPGPHLRNFSFKYVEKYWVDLTDKPRYWYNMNGDRMSWVGMGNDDDNCIIAKLENSDFILKGVSCRSEYSVICVEPQTPTAPLVTTTKSPAPSTDSTTETPDLLTDPTTESPDPTNELPDSTTESSDPTTDSPGSTAELPEPTTESRVSTTESSDPSTDPTTQSSGRTAELPDSTTELPDSITDSPDSTTDPTYESSDATTNSTGSTAELPEPTTESRVSTTESSDPSTDPTTKPPNPTTKSHDATTGLSSKPFKPESTTNQPTTDSKLSKVCDCRCVKIPIVRRPIDLKAWIENMQQELLIPKEKLSSTIRKRNSAVDNRLISIAIGAVMGIMVLSAFFGPIIIGDIINIIRQIKSTRRNNIREC